MVPQEERALATGIASGASSIGAVLVPWLLPFLLLQFSATTIGGAVLGWRGLFILTGAVDILRVIIWMVFYRDPEEHARVSRAELAYLQQLWDRVRGEDSLAEAAAPPPDLALCLCKVVDGWVLVVRSVRLAGCLQQEIQS